jgi:hypothetical protein
MPVRGRHISRCSARLSRTPMASQTWSMAVLAGIDSATARPSSAQAGAIQPDEPRSTESEK